MSTTTTSTTTTTTTPKDRYKLIFFVPVADAETVKAAVFATGAGTIGLYDKTCFTVSGVGQFVPSAEASPHIGEPGKPEFVDEVRCEIQVRGREVIERAVKAIKA